MLPKQPVNLQRRRLVLGTLAALGASSVHAATWQKLCAGSGGANTWRPVTAAAGSANTWRKLGACGGGAPVSLTIAANCKNYNIKTAAIAAGWNGTSAVAVTVTVNAGIIVGSSSTAAYAMDTGSGWPAGSTIAIVNNGYICGRGGNAGPMPISVNGVGTAGQAGGPAINLQWPVTITNGLGYIYAGGGGGGSGMLNTWISNSVVHSQWYGGGGGAGSIAGGPAGPSAVQGANGGLTHGGDGAQPGYFGAGGLLGAVGGKAKAWPAGAGGGGGGASGGSTYGGVHKGGSHGLAITKNSNALTWVSGNTRVYGGVA